MAYWLDTWSFPNSIEYEYKWEGKYGAKGEKRCRKVNITPEQIRKQNQMNREVRVRRLIKANFYPEDLWITIKYPKGTRKPLCRIKKDFSNFIDSLRGKYRRRGHVFKFIYRMEVGKRGGIHMHMVIPRIRSEDTDLLVQKSWKHGRIHFESIYEYGGYEDLAAYIVKQPDEEVMEQLSFFPEEDRSDFIRYGSSRNLVRPEPERRYRSRWTVRRLIEQGPEPTPGYYIDKNTIRTGVNRFTGMSYLYYTEVKVAPVQRPEGGG
ncbi:MAG: hypothetical protein HFI43_12780 [Lachnospiraceae bacterium]|jgi:hypothetical protein|nr:hypothetical protein [Lachnospiraceae bacterium]